MREHMGLYRGKRTDNGEWVEGFYHRVTDNWTHTNIHCITCFQDMPLTGETILTAQWEVYPDTVGECTGLRDKNGKLIFEGDCVEIRYNDHTGEEYVSRRTVSYNPNHGRWYPLCWGEECDFCDAYTEIQSIEVVDNPELLKGGEGE